MESYKIKQNLYGVLQAYITPILTIAIIVAYFIIYNERATVVMWIYLAVIVVFVGYRYLMYIKRPLEIEVSGDQIKFKDIFGKVTELSFSDITDIEVNRRRELFFTLKEKKIRGLNTFKDFDKFLEDAKKKNPALKLWGFKNKE